MTIKHFSVSNKYFAYEWVLVICSSVLLAIWPLPGTIALRHFLLIIGFFTAFLVIRNSRIDFGAGRCWPVWVLFSFFGWLVFHLIFLATDFPEQLSEISGLWVRAFLSTFMGLGLGLLVGKLASFDTLTNSKFSGDWFTNILIAGFGGTVVIFFVRYLYEIYLTKSWLHLNFYMTPYAGKPPVVIFGAIFFTLILIKCREWILRGSSKLTIALLLTAILLVIFAEFFTNTKNGMVMLLVPLIIFCITYIFSYKWNLKKVILAIIIALPIILLVGYVAKKHVEANTAWPMLISDIQIGIDIDSYGSWRNEALYPYPVNGRGVTVNASTYERSAWAVAAIKLISEYPLGYGLVHHSFGALALKKWPDFYKPVGKLRRASHSGLLDFTLGVGIPGLLLVLTPFGAALYRAFDRSDFWAQFIRWIFPVILIAYLITEVSNNHFIEFLFFLVAFCIGLTLKPMKIED